MTEVAPEGSGVVDADRHGGVGFAGALWRRRVPLAVAVVVAGVVGFLLSGLQSPEWTAYSRVFLSARGEFDPLRQGSYSNEPNRFVVNQAAVMTSAPVLERAVEELGAKGQGLAAWQLAQQVEADASGDSDVVIVGATASSARAAADLADAVVAAYRQYVEEQVGRTVAAAVRRAGDPQAASDIRTQGAVYGDGVAVVEAASAPSSPSRPAPGRDGLLLAVVAALLGVALVFVKDVRGAGSGAVRRLAAAQGLPLLGVVPRRAPGVAHVGTPEAQLYGAAAVALDHRASGSALPAAVVVCPVVTGRAAHVAANLASAFVAQGRQSVLVRVDSGPVDVAEQVVRPVALDGGPGPARVVVEPSPAGAPHVTVIGLAGAPTAAGGRGPVGLAALGGRLPDAVEVVVVETGSPVTTPETLSLAPQAAVTVLVVDSATAADELAAAVDRLALVGVRPVGVLGVAGGPSSRAAALRRTLLGAAGPLRAASAPPVPATRPLTPGQPAASARHPLTPTRHPNRAGTSVGGSTSGWWSPTTPHGATAARPGPRD